MSGDADRDRELVDSWATERRIDTLTPVAQATVEEARRQLLLPGYVHPDFRIISIEALPHQMDVYFKWKKNVNTFLASMQLPQTKEDFQYPPLDSPQSWVAYKASGWSEELLTGWVRWAHRDRVGEAIRLGARRAEPNDEYEIRELDIATLAKQPSAHFDTFFLSRLPERVVLKQFEIHKVVTWTVATEFRAGRTSMATAQVVITWEQAPGDCFLEIVDYRPTAPKSVIRRTITSAIHSAADAGAERITAPAEASAMLEEKFIRADSGRHELELRVRGML